MLRKPKGWCGYLEIPAGDKVYEKWTFTAVSPEKLGRRSRIAFITAWGWETSIETAGSTSSFRTAGGKARRKNKLGQGEWTFHPHFLTPDGKGGHLPAADLYVDDLDLDGDNDIMMSSAHNAGSGGSKTPGRTIEPKFEYRVISDCVSQTHALHYVDMNGDGQKDLVTGKRWWAHGPRGDDFPNVDPFVIWFEIHKKKGRHRSSSRTSSPKAWGRALERNSP